VRGYIFLSAEKELTYPGAEVCWVALHASRSLLSYISPHTRVHVGLIPSQE
jgi:hypothetical protein